MPILARLTLVEGAIHDINLSEYRLFEFGTLSSKSLNMHDLHQAKSSYKAQQTR